MSESSRLEAIEQCRSRRVAALERSRVRFEWKVKPLLETVSMSLQRRVELATQYVASKVIVNVSRPVTKTVRPLLRGPNKGKTRTVVTDRSKAGEFPKADTTRMMGDVFAEIRQVAAGVWFGFCGTTLDYGVTLETSQQLNRAWLTRTLYQELENVQAILIGPIK